VGSNRWIRVVPHAQWDTTALAVTVTRLSVATQLLLVDSVLKEAARLKALSVQLGITAKEEPHL